MRKRSLVWWILFGVLALIFGALVRGSRREAAPAPGVAPTPAPAPLPAPAIRHPKKRRARKPFARTMAAAMTVFAIAASTVGAFSQPAAPVPQRPQLPPLSVSVDGVALGRIGLDRGREQPLVQLGPVASTLGWRLLPIQRGARLVNDDRTLTLTIGSREIREDGEVRMLIVEAPSDRGGELFVSVQDAARLLGVKVTRTASAIAFASPENLGSDLQITEVPVAATPHPRPTPRSIQRASDGTQQAPGSVGRVLLSLDRTGSQNLLNLSTETHGSFLQTHLVAGGTIDQIGTPSGTVVVGNAQHNITFGEVSDPLTGIVMRGGAYEGFDIFDASAHRNAYVGHRLDNGLSYAGEQFTTPGGAGTDGYAIVSKGGSYQQMIYRNFRSFRSPGLDFSREFLVGDRGVGLGFNVRTTGRTYFQSTVSFATHGLPLGPNDAPISVNAGRQLSPNTTIAAGAYLTPQQPLSPFLAVSTRSHNFQASISASSNSLTTSLNYAANNASFSLYSVPGIAHASGFNGSLLLPGATIEAQSSSSIGTNDTSLELHTVRKGLNFIGGIGLPNGGRPGPIAGVSIPLGKMFALEGTLRPTASGPYTMRLALAASIGGRRPPTVPTVSATVQVAGAGPSTQALRLFVDGEPMKPFTGATTVVKVTKGSHVFALESIDGTQGSTDTSATIESNGDSVSLNLWPERAVTGRLRLDPAAVLPAGFNLAGIIVVVQPGDISAETNAEGKFTFSKQPFAPESTIRIDPGSLPRGLQGGDPVPLGSGELDLTLLPGLRVERQVFPAK